MRNQYFTNSIFIKLFAALLLNIIINGSIFGTHLIEMKSRQTAGFRNLNRDLSGNFPASTRLNRNDGLKSLARFGDSLYKFDLTDSLNDKFYNQPVNASGSLGFSFSNPGMAGESDGTLTLTVYRYSGNSGAVSVDYVLSDFFARGGASCTPGVDYINTGGRINFADQQPTQTFTIPLCNDSLDEVDEGIRATLVNPVGATILGTNDFTVARVLDDDPTPTISVGDVSQTEGSSGGSLLRFTLALSAPSGRQISISFNTVNGTATAGVDYTRLDGFTFFEEGEVVREILIQITADARVEPDETFFLDLSNSQAVLIEDGRGIGTIINDDVGGNIQFANAAYSVRENGGTAAISVTRANGNASDIMVQYATSNGTAIAGQDYSPVNSILTFGANETSKTFNVPIINDSIREEDETVNISLTAVSGGATLGVPLNATLTIVNDDIKGSAVDFDGDGKSDISVFRPENGTWYLQNSTAGFSGAQFGISSDKIVPADYDGDGKTDIAVYRAGVWYLQRSQTGFTGIAFGANDDVPVPADYDGDGRADLAVFRPSNGTWYLQRSQLGFTGVQFGQSGDKPVAADYDGDGKTDVAVFRGGTWFLNRSTQGFAGVAFGDANDKPTPADYDGDGKADVAVFRPSNGTWYLNRSQLGITGVQFGANGDLPVAADYDGDGRADVAVFRNGTWFLNRSTQGFMGVSFGTTTDKPVANAFIP